MWRNPENSVKMYIFIIKGEKEIRRMLPGIEAQTLCCVMYGWLAFRIEEAIVAQPVSKFQPFQ